MIDLKPNYLRKVKGILAGHVREFDVLVYGARVEGTAKTHSYLDLVVMTDHPLVASRLDSLSAAFAAAGLPFRVEIVDWAVIGKSFRKEIKKNGVLIQRFPAK
ncbi:MAG: nucleotidyltransferase domain-containing protein [Elusimicrobia bacterium]|nr:nucleotidyltransferase domain-containing protein [Elusimicrobiota bacterium]